MDPQALHTAQTQEQGMELDTRPWLDGEAQKRARVLVVDDDPLVLEALLQTLREAGVEGEGVPSMARAQARLEQGPPDVVVTDIMLGDGNGLELLHWISDLYPSLPVILVTGQPDTLHIPDAVKYRACDYVSKPVDPKALGAAVHRAVERRRLLENLIQLHEMNEILCQVLARAVEAKDLFTAGHSQRVAGYTATLALRLGLPPETACDLRVAGQLHDIGKIGIEDQVLTAPRRLSEEEFSKIRRHPATAVEILSPLPRLESVRRWVFEHHERWDGNGYPRGLKGEEISFPGRILILTEVFDALHTRRSYKEAWEMDRILDYYRQERAKHFDPELCDFFVEGLSREGMAFLGAGEPRDLFG